MSQQNGTESMLVSVLERYTDEIAESWTELIYRVAEGRADEAVRARTLRLTRGSVLGIAHAWRTGSYEALEEHRNTVHDVNMQVGASIDWIIESLLLMTDAALPIIMRTYPADSESMSRALNQLDLSLRWMTGYLAKAFADDRSRHLREQQERAEQLLRIARTVGSTLDLESVIDAIRDSLTSAVPGCHCQIFLADDGELVPFPCEAEATSMASAYAAQAIESRSPAIHLRDAPAQVPATGCTAQARQLVTLPFLVRERPVAVAVLCPIDPARPFAEGEVHTAWTIASIVAPVIDHARRHQQVEHLTIRQERDRLSRELHDTLAQVLSVLSLQVGEAEDLLAESQVAAAQSKLQSVRTTLDRAYTDVREAIFNLRHAKAGGSTYLAALKEYLGDYRLHYGIDTRLSVSDRPLPELAPNVQLQLTRIIQEALSNVRKHARVDQARIEIGQEAAWIQVAIVDEGVGFQPSHIAATERQRYGLQVMSERAESVGGTLTIQGQPGQGTRVLVKVPAQRQE